MGGILLGLWQAIAISLHTVKISMARDQLEVQSNTSGQNTVRDQTFQEDLD